jgi:hypothetical protein
MTTTRCAYCLDELPAAAMICDEHGDPICTRCQATEPAASDAQQLMTSWICTVS